MANTSRKSFFKIVNHTSKTADLRVSNVDDYDWDGSSRPDHNLHGRTLYKKSTIVEREELNANASSNMFTLDVALENGKHLIFRIDQRTAIGAKEGDAFHFSDDSIGGDIGALILYATQHGERGTLSVIGAVSDYHAHFSSDGETLAVDVYEA